MKNNMNVITIEYEHDTEYEVDKTNHYMMVRINGGKWMLADKWFGTTDKDKIREIILNDLGR